MEDAGDRYPRVECKRTGLVKANDVLGDVAPCLGVLGILTPPRTRQLQGQEVLFHHCVIPMIAFSTYAANHLMACQQSLILRARVLGGPDPSAVPGPPLAFKCSDRADD